MRKNLNFLGNLREAIAKKLNEKWDEIMLRQEAAEIPDAITGYAVYMRNRDEYVYVEADRKLNFYAELLVGNIDRSIISESIRCWNPPYENEVLSDSEKKRILANICLCFDEQGKTYEIS